MLNNNNKFNLYGKYGKNYRVESQKKLWAK